MINPSIPTNPINLICSKGYCAQEVCSEFIFDFPVFSDVNRRVSKLDGVQSLPPPDVLVDYNYNVAERRSIHVHKLPNEDLTDGGTLNKAGNNTLRKRKKRKSKAASSASDSSTQSPAEVANGPLDAASRQRLLRSTQVQQSQANPTYIEKRATLTAVAKAGAESLPSARPSSATHYVQGRIVQQDRPRSATLPVHKASELNMEAQHHLMQARTPPQVRASRASHPPANHRRVVSAAQPSALESQIIADDPAPEFGIQPTNEAPGYYQDGKPLTYPMVQRVHTEMKTNITDAPAVPIDPIKDMLPAIEGMCHFRAILS